MWRPPDELEHQVMFIQSKVPNVWLIANGWELEVIEEGMENGPNIDISHREGKRKPFFKTERGGEEIYIDPGYYVRFFVSPDGQRLMMWSENWVPDQGAQSKNGGQKYKRLENTLVQSRCILHTMKRHPGAPRATGQFMSNLKDSTHFLSPWREMRDGRQDTTPESPKHPIFGASRIIGFSEHMDGHNMFFQSSKEDIWRHASKWEQRMMNSFLTQLMQGWDYEHKDAAMQFSFRNKAEKGRAGKINRYKGIVWWRSTSQTLMMIDSPWEDDEGLPEEGMEHYRVREVLRILLDQHQGATIREGEIPSPDDPTRSYRQVERDRITAEHEEERRDNDFPPLPPPAPAPAHPAPVNPAPAPHPMEPDNTHRSAPAAAPLNVACFFARD